MVSDKLFEKRIEQMSSLKSWGKLPSGTAEALRQECVVNCGWGRLIFGQTFDSNKRIAKELKRETTGTRDVALYVRDPHVVVSKEPRKLFIDPSLTYRLNLNQKGWRVTMAPGISIEPVRAEEELQAINRIYRARSMVPLSEGYFDQLRELDAVHLLVARDQNSGQIVGCVTGVDHYRAFSDPDNGCSLWALAVDPQTPLPGVGASLVVALADRFAQDGRALMDLSVMHDNSEAIELYSKLGFYQVPVYCIKNKNAINEVLYVGPRHPRPLNVYAQILVDEAYRRGIGVEIIDAEAGMFDLSLGGRTISCRESLTDLTSAVALSRCDDKQLTHRLLSRAGISVPPQSEIDSEEAALTFFEQHSRMVIKPARGEQGSGVFVDLRQPDEVRRAYSAAAALGERVLAEGFVEGKDLRVVVIDNEVVAAAVREPAVIRGDGQHRVEQLIAKLSRRRRAATQGESFIPLDEETLRCIEQAGKSLTSILPKGELLQVRKTANLHTGGTLHDVTEQLHPELRRVAVEAARLLQMPVVGFDLLVPRIDGPDYVFIEANERPGLANHEPQPTAQKFIDLLFPQTKAYPES
ncbi:N-acetylglutaminylglutamine synthetase [Aestuariirhabdus litorea]|uniref:N-acetylglutaminylglutamine synthetase n=1 Tax=Aestuariirhabdus litorea TaxID=2528527 RepID=A0A3P3VJQ4_9GAMM|nr:N-acetylglutaminylglutamine synthetase [Aestuariirhabdus litorea]RRJ82940.1 N-acetylglutaminylglutamine synthetase [Aestuariirhabdus litorea]RWW93099.1 N-acetylglutaminylglutamine synthetase [Endozoicomonadaceae bacterium GTF-13]